MIVAMRLTPPRLRASLVKPKETFKSGIQKTVQWYLDNPVWVEDVVSGSYRDWLQKQYN